MIQSAQDVAANTIVWAIDPFEKTTPNKALVQKINGLFLKSKFQIKPAYVLPLPALKTGEFPEEERLLNEVAEAKETSEKYLQNLGVTDVKIDVLPVRHSGLKTKVEQILSFAEKQKATCLMLSSHGRSGIPRLMMGSFAEALLALSPYPLLFLPDASIKMSDSTKNPRAFFTTDFSSLSKKAFDKFLPSARALKLDLILFYSVSLPSIALEGDYGVPIVLPDNYFSSQVEWAQQKGTLWLKEAQVLGLNARFVVKDSGIGPNTAQVILHMAKHEEADMIVMTSTSSESSSVILGSVAREVFRSRTFPVWVYGPHF
jgi:nucleotide-binding universal stress UspA family protein